MAGTGIRLPSFGTTQEELTVTNVKQSDKPSTLAEFVLLAVRGIHNGRPGPKHLPRFAHELPAARRFSYDTSMLNAIMKTNNIDTEEIIGQLTRSSFPFDKLWIEGPTFLRNHGKQNETDFHTTRVGMLVFTHQQESQFQFLMVREYLVPPDILLRSAGLKALHDMNAKELSMFPPIVDRKVIDSEIDMPVSVSPTIGVCLDEELLLEKLADHERESEALPFGWEGSHVIDDLYDTASFLARLFVLLSSDHIANNFRAKHPNDGKDAQVLLRKNATRKQLKLPPILPVKPIKIDIAEPNRKALNSGNPKKICALLGWTSVRRSKPITSKYGVVFRRREHDRRIPKDEDRRKAAREILSSDAHLTLEIRENRPVKVHQSDASAQSLPSSRP